MNQVTNLIQFKNLSDEQKAEFDFESYEYEFQFFDEQTHWDRLGNVKYEDPVAVYRLVIQPEKWYYVAASGIRDSKPFIAIGESLEAYSVYRILRPATAEEIPKPEKTLKERVEEYYAGCEVLMCYESERTGFWSIHTGTAELGHTCAQLLKSRGFIDYLYEDNGMFTRCDAPTMKGEFPVAALLARPENAND
tara:strand:+ start:835 stop:1413 length:579 start_codon:yes stop_codon:yes gene_type:complete